jgi:hypothetical protein
MKYLDILGELRLEGDFVFISLCFRVAKQTAAGAKTETIPEKIT